MIKNYQVLNNMNNKMNKFIIMIKILKINKILIMNKKLIIL